MTAAISITISVLAFAISSLTAWLTLLRRGTVKATRPTVVFFGHDTAGYGPPKVFLRTLLYSTAKRGRVIQSMHATLSRGEACQTFNIWVYGDKELLRGSGLFVGETGVAANHHFMIPKNTNRFEFIKGVYRLDIFAELVGDKGPIRLLTQLLEVTAELAADLEDRLAGLYFDWEPDSKRYAPHIDKRGVAPSPEELVKLVDQGFSGVKDVGASDETSNRR